MISYAPLLRTLEKKQVSIKDLEKLTDTTNLYTKIKNRKGNTDLINRICKVLNCKIEEVVCWVEKEDKLPKVKIRSPNNKCYGKQVDWNKINDLVQQKYNSLEKFSLANGKCRSDYRGMAMKGSGLKQETINFICDTLNCTEDDILLKSGNGKLKSHITINWDKVSKILSEKGLSQRQFSLLNKHDGNWFASLKRKKFLERLTAKNLCKALGCELKDIEVSDEV